MVVVLTLLGLLVSGGFVLLFRGLRGRVVEQRPTCRACGFNLSGIAEPSASMSDERVRCPECGRDLAEPGAVLPELRRRRPGMLIAGVLLPLMAFGLLIAWGPVSGNAQRMKPVWLLELEAFGGVPSVAAARELEARIGSGDISASRAVSLAERALERQADQDAAWDRVLGDLVISAHRQGHVGDDVLGRFAEHGWEVVVSVRPIVGLGDDVPTAIELRAVRPGLTHAAISVLAFERRTLVDGQEYSRSDAGMRFSLTAGGSVGTSERLMVRRLEQLGWGPLRLGEHEVRVEIDLGVARDSSAEGAKPLAAWTAHAAAPFVVADRAPAIERVDPSSVEGPVFAAVSARVRFQRTGRPDGNVWATLDLGLDRVVADVAGELSFELTMPDGGLLEVPGGTRMLWEHSGSQRRVGRSWLLESPLPRERPTRVDLVIAPSDAAARESATMHRIWGGVIRVEDVDVEWPEARAGGGGGS